MIANGANGELAQLHVDLENKPDPNKSQQNLVEKIVLVHINKIATLKTVQVSILFLFHNYLDWAKYQNRHSSKTI